MNFSQNGLNLLKILEGFRANAYQDVAGYWTIGYGCRISDPSLYPNGISEQDAETLLMSHAQPTENAINEHVTSTLTQNQFDALTIFTYNVGIEAFIESTLLRLVNDSNFAAAALEFKKWDHAGGKVVEGLLDRRLKEQTLFETP